MLLDRALVATWRNFSTLFLLLATITVPLHVGHALVFRSVIAVRDLHPDIETFPEARRVRGVGRAELDQQRRSGLALTVVELALVPIALQAARRVLETDERDEVPTVAGAWRRFGRPTSDPWRAIASHPLQALLVVCLAAAVWGLTHAIGALLVEPLPDPMAFAGVGSAEGIARALGGAVLVGSAAALGVDREVPASEGT